MSARLAACAITTVTACTFSAPTYSETSMGEPIKVGFVNERETQDESSGTFQIPVRLSAQSPSEVTVRYVVSGGTATRNTDFTATDGTLVFAIGDIEKLIDVTINMDGAEESEELIEISLIDPTGAELDTMVLHTVAISADILSRVNFALATSSGSEATPASIVLTLDIPSKNPVTVDYTISGSATQGVDHLLNAGTLMIAANTTSRTFMLTPVDDALYEDDETVVITLSGSMGVVIGSVPKRMHTLQDNDVAPAVGFMAASRTVAEDGVSVDLTVTLSAVSGRTTTVPFSAGIGSATLDNDYTYNAVGALTFPPGTVTRTITLAITDDNLDENTEDVVTTLGTPTNATLNGSATHTLDITDNDDPPVVAWDANETDGAVAEGSAGIQSFAYKIVLSTASGLPITVPIIVTGDATDAVDFTIQSGDIPVTFAPGETEKTVTITVIDDADIEADETVSLVIGTPTSATTGTPSTRTHTIVNDD